MDNANKSVLLINAIVDQDNKSELPTYLSSVMQVFAKHGGIPVARFKTVDKLQGDDLPEITALVEFENASIIKTMVNGEDFMALAELRARVFDQLSMHIGERL
ncbi:MAG: DUF1330 domain-containing protein [Bacteroidota bacterium]